MKINQIGAYAGILFAISAVPLTAKAIDISGDETVTDSVYLANVISHRGSIQYAAGIGLLSVVLLLIHLEWLKDLVSVHAPFAARIARSGAMISAMGGALTFGLTLIAVYGADNKWPDQMVRTTGLLGGNIVGVTFVGMAVFAGTIAALGWKGKFPKWIALVASLEVIIAFVATAVGAPGVAAPVTGIWILINSVGMLLHTRKNA